PRRIRMTRVHLEEDAAKLLHRPNDASGGHTLVDVNRAGSALMEMVGEPDIRTPDEARAFLVQLRAILRYIGVSAANMEEGNLRCDANVSVRPKGSDQMNAKVEVKNMNSFRAVQRALVYEIDRQTRLMKEGQPIAQETRGWVEDRGVTVSQRSKEQAHDYRYFPEPDLPPLAITPARIAALRARLPELPDAKRERFERAYGLTPAEAHILVETRARADTYEAAVVLAGDDEAQRAARARPVALLLIGDVAGLLNELGGDAELSSSALTPAHIAELVRLVEAGTVTAATAKEVLAVAFESGELPSAIVAARGLGQVRDDAEIARIAVAVVEANPKPVADYRAGKDSAIQFLLGQVMRETRGRADPGEARAALQAVLDA
ncbi:MAG: Asp-tRNA(Asn)/Glu-tRNA(Gln) amidotransferase subunit GatB, partial [Chloroflexi bacterium]|nr:Asp-tRNA(Asn)/Glu-tRNA(Gln) amidotransferase subunit GatB [Chloroflexota bacterium]